MTHKITLLETIPVTSDTSSYIFEKPEGYEFTPGQATDLALDREGWRDETRPFTFTSDPGASVLGFTIKSYPDHENGVTRELPFLVPGETVLVGDPWGAIRDKGPGIFIAGGAGITPFIGILRHRARHGSLDGCRLIFANSSPKDIILRPLWEHAPSLETTFVTDEGGDGVRKGRIDGDLLDDLVDDWSGLFYLCGPPPMEDAVTDILAERGVTGDRLVREED